MPDKLTDKEIVKEELEGAKQWFTEHGRNTNTAIVGICERALDLINRLQARVDDLERNELPRCKDALKRANEMGMELQAENERLNDILDKKVVEFAYNKKQEIKAEAYKEFAERLKEDISNHRTEMYMNGLKGTPRTKEITYECVEEYIDNLLKELGGE